MRHCSRIWSSLLLQRFASCSATSAEPWQVLGRSFVICRRSSSSLICLLLAWAALSAVAADPKRVLIVHSFGSAAPPFTTHSTAFETELTEKMGQRVDLDEVSLDMARYADPDMQEALVNYLQKRQARWQPDLVVPIGSPAGVFVAQYRDRLFPKTPIVYCGLDRRRLPPDALQKNAAFVGEDFNLPGFVEDVLQIAPATTNIAVVIGASTLEQYWTTAFRKEFEPFTNRVSFSWLNDLTFDEMLERVSKLPPRSFIFLILLLRDASGVTHNADEALKRIHAVANAPVNSIFQHQLGLGIVGGRLYQAEQEGVESARLAIRILRGEPASSFPPKIIDPLSPQYDWRELPRWKINENRLPPGNVVLFREPTIWERYGSWIIAGTSLCAVQALLIFVLLANLVKRRRAERSLEESRNRLRSILDTAVEGIITINERSVIESVNAATEKIFGYPAAEVIGQNVSMLIPQPHREERNQHLANQQGTRQPKIIGAGREISGRRKDGSLFPIDLAVSEIALAGRRVWTGFVRDITERKQAEQAARELSGRLLHAQEAERARLARELHDDITQRLALLAIVDAQWNQGGDAPRLGAPLEPGWVRLKSGLAQIVFYSGARVVIEGPTELRLVSPSEASCPSGRLTAEFPPQAHGFRVRTPQMSVTDLGTAFGLDVKERRTELLVFKGSVEFQSAAGTAKQNLKEGAGAVAESSGPARLISANPTAFASLFDLQLKSSAAEVLRHEQWRAASSRLDEDPSLLVHFDFEQTGLSDWRLPNTSSRKNTAPDATIVGCQWVEGRWPDKHALEFRGVSDRVRLSVPGEFESLTLTAWVRVQGLDRQFNSLFMSDGFEAGTLHWLIRKDGVLGLTAIGAGSGNYQICASPPVLALDQFGIWLHLAVVLDGTAKRVVQYVNGLPVSEKPLKITPPFRIGAAELGNWNASGFPDNDPSLIRNFSGAMDEFCLFSRALPPSEIRALYSSDKPQPVSGAVR